MTQRDQSGAATLLVMAMAGVLLFLGGALAVVMALFAAHRVAQAAADLAALSGARAVSTGGDGCEVARRIALANRARLTACEISGRVVEVEVEATGPSWLGQSADLSARSRAGPAR